MELTEILYIVGYTLIMSGVIQSSDRVGVDVSQDTPFLSISNIGKMASIGILINAFFVFSWWIPIVTFVIAIPLGPLMYFFFDKLKTLYAPHLQVVLGIVLCAIALS